jgi:hypothetical protein
LIGKEKSDYMGRPKGALNRKTREALHAFAESSKEYEDHGKAAITYLSKIMLDPQRDEGIRMRAADILLPFVRPKLSAVEQTNIDPAAMLSKDAAEALEKEALLLAISRDFAADPELKALVDAYKAKAGLASEPGGAGQ